MTNRKNFLSSIGIAFISNLVSLFSSTLITLILPKFLGITEYAYYQLYIFYVGYLGFFNIGWIEGIYLRYGGVYYEELDKNLFSSQFRSFCLMESVISISIIVFSLLVNTSIEKKAVFFSVAICLVIYLPRAFLHTILQTTGRIKEYASAIIFEKIIHIVGTTIGVVLNNDFFLWYIISEIVGRGFALIFITIQCLDIIKAKPFFNQALYREINENIKCGLAMMISNITSMLIIGFIRQIIEWRWDVETFGKISLTLSVSNLAMVFINSLALVIFPQLKRISDRDLKKYYGLMRTLLMIPILGILIIYHPFKTVLSVWLPKYSESLKYMAILFPICVFDCKMSLLITTYMKVLRKGKTLLAVNVISFVIGIILSIISCYILNSLNCAIITILIVLTFRSVFTEMILNKYIEINPMKDIMIEILLTLIFIFSSWYINSPLGTLLYFFSYILYLYINRERVLNAKETLK